MSMKHQNIQRTNNFQVDISIETMKLNQANLKIKKNYQCKYSMNIQ